MLFRSGYPLGFIIGPIMEFSGWQEQYGALLDNLSSRVGTQEDLHFELITHRYTVRAKNNIAEVFPDSTLVMTEDDRQFKYGQFGYGKYIYPKALMNEIESFFRSRIAHIFPHSTIDYFV